MNSIEPGQSTNVMVSSRNETLATLGSMLMPWARASALESPTLSPLDTRPDRPMVPVRSRMASRRVVLPLWKGPTMAMHRGPLASLPLVAMKVSFPAPQSAILTVALPTMLCLSGPVGKLSRSKQNGPACAGPLELDEVSKSSGAGAQFQIADAEREVEAGLAADGERLQRDCPGVAADEHIGSEASDHGRLGGRAHIVAGKRARQEAALGEDGPSDDAALRGADVEPEFPNDDRYSARSDRGAGRIRRRWPSASRGSGRPRRQRYMSARRHASGFGHSPP